MLDGLERWLKGWHHGGLRGETTLTDLDRSGYDSELDDFLQQVSGLTNGSHVVLTTRARPHALDTARCTVVPVYEPGTRTELEGLTDDDALALLCSFGVPDNAGLLKAANHYANHPMALEILGFQVAQRYGGEISQIPLDSPLRFGDLPALLTEAREHLPDREESERVLYVAALCFENPSLSALTAGLGREASKRSEESLLDRVVMLATWQMLKWDGRVVRLHPLIKDHFQKFPPRVTQPEDATHIHGRLSRFYGTLPISNDAKTLPEAKGRLLAIKHAHLAHDLAGCSELMFSMLIAGYSFSEWLIARGHLVAGDELLSVLVPDATSDEMASDFRISRAAMRRWLGRLGDANSDLDRSIDWLRNRAHKGVSHRRKLVVALNNRGGIHRAKGELQDALRDYQMAIRVLPGWCTQTASDALVMATLLANRGRLQRHVGRLKDALRDIQRAIRICERIKYAHADQTRPLLAHTMWAQANVLADQGEFARAIDCFDRALGLYQSLVADGKAELEPELAHVCGARAAMLRRMRRPEEARRAIEESIGKLQKLIQNGRAEWEACLALALIALAEIQGDLGAGEAAVGTCNQVVQILERLKESGREDVEQSLAYILFVRATLRLTLGEANAAEDLAASLTVLRRFGDQGATHFQGVNREREVSIPRGFT